MKVLMDCVPELEEEWSATRYPGWQDDRIWIPSESYTVNDATETEARMNSASDILMKFLEGKHGIK